MNRMSEAPKVSSRAWFTAGVGTVNMLSAAILVVLLAVSLNSLTTFPDSFADEGFYAQAGLALATTGTFKNFDLPDRPCFKAGDGIHARLGAAVFGFLSRVSGESITTARAVSFAFVWIAVLLWLPITKALGAPPFLGALLFAASERVFWASHVFRPEAALILMNTVLILAIIMTERLKSQQTLCFGRGLLNAPLVLAHGNGLVSALVNTVDLLTRRGQPKRPSSWVRVSLYGVGSLLAVGLFYLVQVRPVGGWRVCAAQFQVAAQYHLGSGLWDMLRSDLELRWGKELFVVGGSAAAKGLCLIWYAVIFVTAAHSAGWGRGQARRLALAAIGTVLGYTLLVRDRADIHIAEMVPFFVASFLAWLAAAWPHPDRRRVASVATATLLIAGLGLCLHHAIRYRPQAYTPKSQLMARAIRDYLESPTGRALPTPRVVIGNDSLWFWLHDTGLVLPVRLVKNSAPRAATMIVVEHSTKLPWLDRCVPNHADAERRFITYVCPAP